MTRFAVISFPGSNCDDDCVRVVNEVVGETGYKVRHDERTLDRADVVLAPARLVHQPDARRNARQQHRQHQRHAQRDACRRQHGGVHPANAPATRPHSAVSGISATRADAVTPVSSR